MPFARITSVQFPAYQEAGKTVSGTVQVKNLLDPGTVGVYAWFWDGVNWRRVNTPNQWAYTNDIITFTLSFPMPLVNTNVVVISYSIPLLPLAVVSEDEQWGDIAILVGQAPQLQIVGLSYA